MPRMLVSENSTRDTKTRTTDVKELMLDWIRQGKYPPSSQFPSIPELVNRLEVSRTVVREALQSLVGMGLIDMRAGSGCYVKSVPPSLIVNADVMAALIDLDTLIEVAEARKAVEASVARLAAVSATPENFEDMEIILNRIQRLAKKNQPMYSVTPDFHVAVARATHNSVLERIVSSFNSLMAAAGQVIEREQVGYQYRIGEYESHLELLEILQQRNPAAAQVAMEEHIQKTVDVLKEVQVRPAAKRRRA